MIFYRIKSEGIAHNSYLVGSGNKAAVIDPRRDCSVYVELAQKHGLQITHIFETHRNEDNAIGSIELQHFTGAEIFHGPGPDRGFGSTLEEGQRFRYGCKYFITGRISEPVQRSRRIQCLERCRISAYVK